MSVAPGGRIDVVWNDTRNTLVSIYSQLFYTCSEDGGLTWAPNRQVSQTWGSYLGFPGQNKIGDYYDTVSDDVGVHVAYAATYTGGQDIYYLRIGDYDCNANAVGDSLDIAHGTSADTNGNGIPDECEDGVSDVAVGPPAASAPALHCSPNPFNPVVTVAYELPAAGRARPGRLRRGRTAGGGAAGRGPARRSGPGDLERGGDGFGRVFRAAACRVGGSGGKGGFVAVGRQRIQPRRSPPGGWLLANFIYRNT